MEPKRLPTCLRFNTLGNLMAQASSGLVLNTDLSILEDKSILIVEDDPDIAGLIQLHLQDTYRHVEVATDGLQGYQLASEKHWDIILLDLRLPGKDGLELCKELRANHQYVPILMLTSKSSELDRVLGLELGADDYVTKPFSTIELMARIKAILRRTTNLAVSPLPHKIESAYHQITLDTDMHQVTKKGQLLELTSKEFELLKYFLQNPKRVFSRAHLLKEIWGYGHEGYEHTVNSHINRLRAKIEDNPTAPKIICTVWGVGYKMDTESDGC